MTTKDFEFTQVSEDRYISNPVEPNGDTSIELRFASDKSYLRLEQSITGENWMAFKAEYYSSVVYITNITGILPGQKIRLICSSVPVVAKYLQNE